MSAFTLSQPSIFTKTTPSHHHHPLHRHHPPKTSRKNYHMCQPTTPPPLETLLKTHQTSTTLKNLPPIVHLVGTGPGDPSLLTLRALTLMKQADVVLYDRLISPEILELVGDQAQMVYVGKRAGYHTRSQEEICELLGIFAQKTSINDKRRKVIVRLKGGDPYVFGRGGEEVEYLEGMGVDVRVTPGITAAAGIGAELGIPMTSRGVASGVKFVTGHLREGLEGVVGGDVGEGVTLVVYMGLGRLEGIVGELMGRGVRGSLPGVAVERGCTREQRVVWGTVDCLAEKVREVGLESPTLIIIGGVVAMARGWKAQYGEHVRDSEKETVESSVRSTADVI